MGDLVSGIKVYWQNPDGTTNYNHDDQVRDAIGECQKFIGERNLPHGIGVIDFADCTVVVASRAIPSKEVFVTDRTKDNSILQGGFGPNPFA